MTKRGTYNGGSTIIRCAPVASTNRPRKIWTPAAILARFEYEARKRKRDAADAARKLDLAAKRKERLKAKKAAKRAMIKATRNA